MGKPNLAYDSSRLRCASSLVLGRSLEYELSHSGSRTARCPTSAALPKSTRQMEGSAGRLQTCPLVVAGGGGVGKQALVDRHTLCAATYCCIGATCFHKVAHLCVALSRARMSSISASGTAPSGTAPYFLRRRQSDMFSMSATMRFAGYTAPHVSDRSS
jgi:hypothetical protein